MFERERICHLASRGCLLWNEHCYYSSSPRATPGLQPYERCSSCLHQCFANGEVVNQISCCLGLYRLLPCILDEYASLTSPVLTVAKSKAYVLSSRGAYHPDSLSQGSAATSAVLYAEPIMSHLYGNRLFVPLVVEVEVLDPDCAASISDFTVWILLLHEVIVSVHEVISSVSCLIFKARCCLTLKRQTVSNVALLSACIDKCPRPTDQPSTLSARNVPSKRTKSNGIFNSPE